MDELKVIIQQPAKVQASIRELPMLTVSYPNVEVVSGEGGTRRHSQLTERDLPDQHPIDAITGLREALDKPHFKTDETLSFKDGMLSVNTSHEPDPDNTLPITSAAVAVTVGNIDILLQTI